VPPKTRATLEDLYKIAGKAELVNGQIVGMAPTGGRPGRASLEIAMSVHLHERQHGGGYAFSNNVAFAVKLPHRESFGPDASWYVGALPDMRFP
jgi:Uma2 family endonuclease